MSNKRQYTTQRYEDEKLQKRFAIIGGIIGAVLGYATHGIGGAIIAGVIVLMVFSIIGWIVSVFR